MSAADATSRPEPDEDGALAAAERRGERDERRDGGDPQRPGDEPGRERERRRRRQLGAELTEGGEDGRARLQMEEDPQREHAGVGGDHRVERRVPPHPGQVTR